MGLIILLLLLALLFGGVGLFVEGLEVLILVMVALLLVSWFSGRRL